jgi:hypothetical protein
MKIRMMVCMTNLPHGFTARDPFKLQYVVISVSKYAAPNVRVERRALVLRFPEVTGSTYRLS